MEVFVVLFYLFVRILEGIVSLFSGPDSRPAKPVQPMHPRDQSLRRFKMVDGLDGEFDGRFDMDDWPF